jgi:hypothetical protein
LLRLIDGGFFEIKTRMEKVNMRGYRIIFIAAVLAALLSTTAAAQDVLKYFPEDVFMVVQIDLKTTLAMFPPEIVNEWKSKTTEEVGFDLFSKFDSMSFGIPDSMMSGNAPADFYGLINGRFTLDDIKAGIQKTGKQFKTVQVGSMSAISSTNEGEEDAYIAQVAPGMFIVGSEEGLEKFQAITGGSINNATGNAMLNMAMADANKKGFLRVAGYFDDTMKKKMASQMPSMGDLNTFALVADYANDFLSINTVLNSDSSSALDELKMTMEQQLPMVTQMDTTGALAEIVTNLKIDINGTKMTISTGLSKATLDALFEQFGGMFKMAMPQ